MAARVEMIAGTLLKIAEKIGCEMQISDEGLRLIRSFEGYHTRLKDGSCAAYLCPAHVPTIGFGCTEGVRLGMVWTAEEAEAALRREIAKFEAAVNRLVTVSINQNEFDAMVSLAYNIGAAAFERSSVLKRLNKGDRSGAGQVFEMWNKGGAACFPVWSRDASVKRRCS